MATLVSKKFNVHNATQFKEAFDESDPSQMYLFYSKIDPWDDENNPPALEDTVFSDRNIWRGMTALKKISNNDVTMATTKYVWASNTVYTQYDDTNANLPSSNFYVLTSNNEVYKCLFNADGAPSTVLPTGRSTSVVTTGDGYKWKFMYDISQADINRFGVVHGGSIPVKTLTSDDGSAQWAVQQASSNGSVPVYQVTAGGADYLENKGTFAGITSTTQLTIANTALDTDNVYNGSSIFISSGLGAGQQRIIIGYNATTKLLTVNSAFTVSPNTSSTYHIGPRINIVGDGNGASAYANVVSGAVTKITPINEGTSYSRARVVISANPSYGANAAAKALLPDVGGHGSDAINELFARNVTMNVEVVEDEGGFFPANNQFRIYGIIKDPTLRATGTVASGPRYDQTLRLTVSSVSGILTQDEFVQGQTSGAKGRVVNFANSNLAHTAGVLHLAYPSGTFANSETLTANTSGVTAVVNAITPPDLVPYSGKMIYMVTRPPIERDMDQTENFTITAKF
jgi:hypothetical protein